MSFFTDPNRPVRIFALDTETTGLNKPHAFQIAVLELAWDDHNAQERLRTVNIENMFFDPKKSIEPEASAVNGFTDEMIAQKVAEENLPSIFDFDFVKHFNITPADDVYFVGQNVVFDIQCLINTSNNDTKYWLKEHLSKRIDSRDICRNHLSYSGITKFNLVSLYTIFENDLLDEMNQFDMDEDEFALLVKKTEQNAHTALVDTLRSVFVINKMAWRLDITSLDELYLNSLRLNNFEYEQLIKYPQELECSFVDVQWRIVDNVIEVRYSPVFDTPENLPSVETLVKFGHLDKAILQPSSSFIENSDRLNLEFGINLEDGTTFEQFIEKISTIRPEDYALQAYCDTITSKICDAEEELNRDCKEVYISACINMYNMYNYS